MVFRLNFGQNGEAVAFPDFAALKQSLADDAMRWLQIGEETPIKPIGRRLSHRLLLLRSQIPEFVELEDQTKAEAHVASMARELKAIPFDSRIGEDIRLAVSNGQTELAFKLAEIDPNKPAEISWGREWMPLIEQAVNGLLPVVLPAALHDAIPDPKRFLANVQTFAEDLHLLKQQQGEMASSMREVVEKSEALMQGIEERTTKLQAEWENTLEAYRQQLELSKTSDLWSARATLHRTNKEKLGGKVVWAGVCTFLAVVAGAFLFFRGGPLITGSDDPFIGTVFGSAGTLLVLTLGLWATRVFVRLYMTEHHLAIDAESRAALGDTYISLTADGDAAQDDRKIVLAALFRPVNDGIVNDDALPLVSPAAIMSSYLSGDKSGAK